MKRLMKKISGINTDQIFNIALKEAKIKAKYEKRTFESILGRINYSYNGKYLLTFVGRRDGSSVFEKGNVKSNIFFPFANEFSSISLFSKVDKSTVCLFPS